MNRSEDGDLVVGHVWAVPGATRAVVLVHGVGSSSRAYAKLADRLVVRGERDPVAPQHWAETLAASAPAGRQRTVRGRHHAMDADGDGDGVTESVLEAWRAAGRGTG
ncbi:hypothetical protein [Promicromonospora soli]